MHTLRASVMCIMLVLLVSACGRTTSSSNPASLEPTADAATVQVSNNNWATMVVYAIRSGLRVRLGTVESMRTARFTISAPVVSGTADVRLIADPVGSNSPFITPPVQVTPGQQIEFNIENHLPTSNVSVWNR